MTPGAQYALVLWRLVALAAYVSAIHLAYRDIFAVQFGYLRYGYADVGLSWILVGFVIAAVPGLMLPRMIARPADLVLWVLYLFVVVPICQVPIYGGTLRPETAVGFALFVAVIFCGMILLSTRKAPVIVPLGLSATPRPLIAFVVVFSLITYSLVISTFGFTIDLMSFLEVYDTRLEYRDEIAPSIPILGYLVSNQGNALNPFVMIWATSKRKWWILLPVVVGQVLLYSATGYKTLALSIPLCLVLGLVLPRIRSVNATLVMWTMTGVAWLSILLRDYVAGLVELVMNRAIIAPAHITAAYVLIYEDSPKALWSHSFLRPFVDDPYGLPPGLWVGRLFFGRDEVNANANLFADGFANLGYAGIAVEAALLVILLVLLNSASRGLSPAFILGTIAIPAFSAANGSPFSAILSYGVAMSIVLFMLMPRDAGSDSRDSHDGSPNGGSLTKTTAKI